MVGGEDGNGHKKSEEVIAEVANVSDADGGDDDEKSEEVVDVIGNGKGNSSR